ncbi:MCE family protein [Nocardioides ganghwensis]|uniref:MCE family protein n=1 Tax=Nocardioides ganghwensis TaxID=252230 RepID=A0A4Q2SG81_9ACTN|nr:MCE family protein [Nocardioides ganghwensis]MBD3944432.1 MCE family protein [Nocardioides ganghwensis]RYC04202.1 MCE family protein [Nocardioides ganghwensis]
MRPQAGLRALVLGMLGSLLLAGCDASVYSLPLPGGPDVGEDPMTVKVEFADVLDLVPQSTVKVNDVSVGKVTDIDLEGYQALVTLAVRRDVELPDNAVAELRQTSLLGEKFVELSAPEEGASSNPLGDGDTIPIERAGRNPEVEEVLGALSLLLNGGGVAQLKTITQELNKALEGREESARSVLRNLRTFTGQLDENKADIVAAIESLNRLALAAEKQLPTIDKALDELPSALDSIDRQRDDLVEMLAALNDLSDVAVDVIARSKGATIASLERLDPVLTQLAASGDDFTNAFHVFLTYPFVDEVVGRDPQVARNLHMGDYTNLSITLDVDVQGGLTSTPTLPTNLPTVIDPTVVVNDVLACLQSGSLTSEACAKVLANLEKLTRLREECAKSENKDKDVCRELNSIPGLPPEPSLPIPSTLLPTLVPTGLPRAGTREEPRPGNPTMGDLMEAYDPDLVSLLIPGMVQR